MLKHLQSKKGFTLIELMIVVAIIGILAAIAIPNFLKFQAKSRQAEAKTNLGGLFTAEESYRAEFSNYNTDLIVIGWGPTGSPRYIYGFNTAGATPQTGSGTPGNRHTAAAAICGAGQACAATNMVRNDGTTALAPGDLVASTAAATFYTAAATGNVDNDDTLDQWTMTATRVLVNVAGNNDVSN